MPARFALLSTSDKTGSAGPRPRPGRDAGYTLLSTGGTARVLREAGLDGAGRQRTHRSERR